MRKLVPVKVESHSGYKADEYPESFVHEDIRFEIHEITDRWYQGDRDPDVPVADYFKVETTCGKQFLLKHEIGNDQWYVVL